ncbi:MAG: long-chain fatty acid--CoA ligase, partial [Cellulomonas sp.]|nr:long-chain fatty acid--CoA ligase [Cellulomonas sp.]
MPPATAALPVPPAYPTGVPREVVVPDEPLGVGLVSAAVRYPNRVGGDFLGRTTTDRQLSDEVARAAQVLV